MAFNVGRLVFGGFSRGPNEGSWLVNATQARDDGYLLYLNASYDGESGRVFESAIAEVGVDLELSNWWWITAPESPLGAEGGTRMSSINSELVQIGNKAGRGAIFAKASGECVSRVEPGLARGDTHPPALITANGSVCLGVSGTIGMGRIENLTLMRGSSPLDTVGWTELDASRDTIKRSGLANPWVCQICALDEGRFLVAVVTDGQSKPAYPNKSMPFRYSIVDYEGQELAHLKHKEGSAGMHVYDHGGQTLFPSDFHPFYPAFYAADQQQVVQKLHQAIRWFSVSGALVGELLMSEKGLSRLKNYQLLAVTRAGIGLFYLRSSDVAFTVDLFAEDLAKRIAAALTVAAKAAKSGDMISVEKPSNN